MTSPHPDSPPILSRTGRPTLIFLAVTIIGLAVGLTANPSSLPPEALPMVGRTAPEVVIDLFPEGEWRLSRHLAETGRPVILNLYASWCVPCKTEIPLLSRASAVHPEIAFLGAAVRDTRSDAEALIAELAPKYRVGIDASGRLRDSYLGFGMPALYAIDSSGTIVGQVEGGIDLAGIEELVDLLAQPKADT